jgi:hypothetical protein
MRFPHLFRVKKQELEPSHDEHGSWKDKHYICGFNNCDKHATNGVKFITAPNVFNITVSNVGEEFMFCTEHFIQVLQETAEDASQWLRTHPVK